MESGTHAVRLTSTVRPCVVRRRRQNMAASEMRIDRPLVRPSSLVSAAVDGSQATVCDHEFRARMTQQ